MRQPQAPIPHRKSSPGRPGTKRRNAGVDWFVVEWGAHLNSQAVTAARSADTANDTWVVAQGPEETAPEFLTRVGERLSGASARGRVPRRADYFLSGLDGVNAMRHRLAVSGTLIQALTHDQPSVLTLVGAPRPDLGARTEFWQLVERVTALASASDVALHALPYGYSEANFDQARHDVA